MAAVPSLPTGSLKLKGCLFPGHDRTSLALKASGPRGGFPAPVPEGPQRKRTAKEEPLVTIRGPHAVQKSVQENPAEVDKLPQPMPLTMQYGAGAGPFLPPERILVRGTLAR